MGLIGSIVGGAASLAGGLLSGKKIQEQDALFNDRIRDIKAHRDNLYYRDPTQSAENQAAVTQSRELLNEQTKRAAATAAIAGGTPEAVALAKKQASDTVGDMLQKQAAQGAQQREQIWNQAEQGVDAYTKYLADSKRQQAQAIASTAGGLSNTASNLPI